MPGTASVESEPTLAEQGKDPQPQERKQKRNAGFGNDADLTELVSERFRQAAQHRRTVEHDWVLAVAFAEGRQWLAWDDTANQAISLMQDDERDKYVTCNLIEPLLDKLIALATMTKPDAAPAPESESDIDRAAAAEARAITAHLYRLFDRANQTQDIVRWAATCGVAYLKEAWNPAGRAAIALQGADGTVSKKISAPVGEVCSEVVPPFEIFCDPRAKRFEQTAWLIHASVKPLAWIKRTYGVDVDGTDAGTPAGYLDPYTSTSGGGGGTSAIPYGQTGADAKKRSAAVLEMWEKPTPRYPKGRLIVTCGDTVLHTSEWQLADRETFPFARLVFREASGHVYGRGVVPSLISRQISINRLLTKAVCEVEDNKHTLLITKGAGIGADAFSDDEIEEKRTWRTIHSNPGVAPPTWIPHPATSGDVEKQLALAWQHMQDIAGVHDVNMGGTPEGVTAGISIELLQQGDRTQLGLFTQRIESLAVQRDEIDIALYAQYVAANLPRLMGLDDTGNPAQARAQAQSFAALTGGGSVSVIVQPGSATPKSPAGKKQEIIEYFNLGLFNPTVPGAATAIKLLSLPQSDQITDLMQTELAAIQQQQAAAAQQAQAQQAQAQQQQSANAAQLAAQQHQQQLVQDQTKIAAQAQAAAAAKTPAPDAPDNTLAIEQMRAQAMASQTAQQNDAELARHEQEARTQLVLDTHKSNLAAHATEQKAAITMREKMADAALKIHIANHLPKPEGKPKNAR